LLWRTAPIPIPFIYTHNLTSLITDAIIGKEIRRVGKYHIKLEIKLGQQLETITMQQSESTIMRFIKRRYHFLPF